MPNIIELQNKLEKLSDDQLLQGAKTPDGSVPQYLYLLEMGRRKNLRTKFGVGDAPSTTVADDMMNEQQPQQQAQLQPPGMDQGLGAVQGFQKGGSTRRPPLPPGVADYYKEDPGRYLYKRPTRSPEAIMFAPPGNIRIADFLRNTGARGREKEFWRAAAQDELFSEEDLGAHPEYMSNPQNFWIAGVPPPDFGEPTMYTGETSQFNVYAPEDAASEAGDAAAAIGGHEGVDESGLGGYEPPKLASDIASEAPVKSYWDTQFKTLQSGFRGRNNPFAIKNTLPSTQAAAGGTKKFAAAPGGLSLLRAYQEAEKQRPLPAPSTPEEVVSKAEGTKEETFEERFNRRLEKRKKSDGDPYSKYDTKLANQLARDEEDKHTALWLNVAKAGAGIAGSKNPNLMGAIAEGVGPAISGYASDMKGIRSREERRDEFSLKIQQAREGLASQQRKSVLDFEKGLISERTLKEQISNHQREFALNTKKFQEQAASNKRMSDLKTLGIEVDARDRQRTHETRAEELRLTEINRARNAEAARRQREAQWDQNEFKNQLSLFNADSTNYVNRIVAETARTKAMKPGAKKEFAEWLLADPEMAAQWRTLTAKGIDPFKMKQKADDALMTQKKYIRQGGGGLSDEQQARLSAAQKTGRTADLDREVDAIAREMLRSSTLYRWLPAMPTRKRQKKLRLGKAGQAR